MGLIYDFNSQFLSSFIDDLLNHQIDLLSLLRRLNLMNNKMSDDEVIALMYATLIKEHPFLQLIILKLVIQAVPVEHDSDLTESYQEQLLLKILQDVLSTVKKYQGLTFSDLEDSAKNGITQLIPKDRLKEVLKMIV